ncbi:MAG: hypothetical protein H6Q90_6190 [Deltaproteobacteria bacterium]|nr:hypothetical protein [Deltaproteobacteria bacterium]
MLAVTALIGCSFEIRAPDLADETSRTLVDDTAADFESPSERIDVTTPKRGVIEPDAFALDVLQMEAYAKPYLQQADVLTWDQLEALLPADTRSGVALTGSVDADYSTGSPFGVGLVNITDNFTIIYRGELYLPAGTTTLELASDGPSLLEIAAGADGTYGTRMFARTSAPVLTPRVDVSVPAAGWYPIRAALTDTTGAAWIRFREVRNNVVIAFGPERFRTRISEHRGIVMQVFDEPVLVRWAAEVLHVDALSLDYGTGIPPNDVPVTGDFGLRLVGQLLIEEPGTYTFGGSVDGRVRILIDREVVAGVRWPGVVDGSSPVTLTAGWHDLIVDCADVGGIAAFKIAMLSAPANVLLGTITPEMLRPVTRFGRLTATSLIGSTLTISESSRTTFNLPPVVPAVPADATVEMVDVGYILNHGAPAEVTVSLLLGNSTDTLRVGDPTVSAADYLGVRTAFAGMSVADVPGWRLGAIDTVTGGLGTFSSPTVSVAYRRAMGPISRTAVFASRARPTPGALELDAVRIVGELPAGATVTTELRPCATETTCGDSTWLPASAEMEPIAAAELVQYRLSITTDGFALPSIDKVEIDYRVAE